MSNNGKLQKPLSEKQQTIQPEKPSEITHQIDPLTGIHYPTNLNSINQLLNIKP